MNLREYVRDEIARADDLTPATIAATIAGRMSPQQRAECFDAALPALVREVILQTRPSARRAVGAHEPAADQAPYDAQGKSVGGANVTPIGRSWKRDAIRESWRRDLEAIYPDAAGRNRRMGEFTADDLDALSQRCAEQAKANASASAHWESLARAVRAAGVDRLADVPGETLASLLGGAA